jgi:hypothetical protein
MWSTGVVRSSIWCCAIVVSSPHSVQLLCSQVNQTAETKKPRKNRRKSTIQLVPGPLLPSEPVATEAAPRDIANIPLKLPRAMSSVTPAESNPPLTDRNAAKPDESVSTGSKNSTGAAATRAPSQLRKNATTEKENQLR